MKNKKNAIFYLSYDDEHCVKNLDYFDTFSVS